MKNLKTSIATLAIAAALLTVVSCKKSFYTKVNVNPNAPSSVTPGTLLSGIEVSLAYTVGGDLSRFTSMFTQQTIGVSRQSAAYYSYVFTNQDIETPWDNMYSSVMENDYTLMHQADAAGDNEYSGIARVLMAYSLQVTVDYWGYVPYSQALQGGANIQPSFDVDQAVYAQALALLNQGIVYLSNSTKGGVVPASDDFLYTGSETQWIKFAHAIKARLFIHQTKKSSVAMCDSALAEVGKSFGSNADDAQIAFGTAATNNNPWYQFNTQRGDIEFAYTNYTPGNYAPFSDSLIKEKDPRYSFLLDSSGESSFATAGLATFYGGSAAIVPFITYSELQFVAAEATLRTTGVVAAQPYYTAGITANITKVGATAGTFTTTGSQALLPATVAAAIMQNAWQENVALFLNPEAWTLWRRCNWKLIPVTGSSVPRRFLYPQSELNLNGAHVPSATQFSPVVFWDN